MSADYRVASTIIEQLGGHRFMLMTGAKNVSCTDNSVRMKLGRNSSNSNFLKIELNSLDLYDMTFAKVTRMGEMKSVKQYEGVYNDMLVEIFERHTGLYTSL